MRFAELTVWVSTAASSLATVALAQGNLPEPMDWTREQDHQNMMDQLGITELRPGPSGQNDAPNAANYDESTANRYPDWPDLLTLDVRTRLARALVDLADRFGQQDATGSRIDLRITQTELGQLVGSTRESTSVAFNAFRRRGWVSSQERQIWVIDREELAAV